MYAIRTVAALCGCVVSWSCSRPETAAPAPPSPVTPAAPVVVEGKNAIEWLDVFASSSGRDLPTLWKAHDCDDHSPEFEARLLRLHKETADALGLEAVDAFLDLRRIPHECPGIPEYDDAPAAPVDHAVAIPAEPLAWPLHLLDGSDDELVALLDDSDVERRSRAAMTLLARQSRASEVIESLVRRLDRETHGTWPGTWTGPPFSSDTAHLVYRANLDAYVLNFAKHYLGSGFDEALAKLLASSSNDASFRRFLVKQVGFSKRATTELLCTALAPWVDDGGATTRAIVRAILSGLGYESHSPYFAVTRRYTRYPNNEPAIEVRAATVLRRCLETLARETSLEADDVLGTGLALHHSATIRDHLVPTIAGIARDGGLASNEAYRLLALAGVDDEVVRVAFIQRVTPRIESGEISDSSEAMLVRHDRATLDCLERAIRTSKTPWMFTGAVVVIDKSESDLALRIDELRRFVESLQCWSELYFSSWPYEPAFDESDPPLDRVFKLALMIELRRKQGMDDSEFVEQIAHALDGVTEPEGNFGPGDPYTMWGACIHELRIAQPNIAEFALRYLSHAENWHHTGEMVFALEHQVLSKEQSRALALLSPEFVSSHQIAEILAGQTHGLFEVIPRVRLEFTEDLSRDYDCARARIDLERLDRIFQSGAISRRAREWLARALERGLAYERERALRIVDERNVDDADFLPVLRRCAADPDAAVRSLAAKVLAR